MHRLRIFSAGQPSDNQLEQWLRSRCRALQQEYEIDFDFDFATDTQSTMGCPTLLSTIGRILEKASQSAPRGSTIDVGTYLTRRGLEIEVSTTDDSEECEATSAFRKESSSVGNGFSLSIYRARCPQGGTAWIIVQSHFARLRMVA